MSASRLALPLALVPLALAACRAPRQDDPFEPNDEREQATLLALDAPVTARANQGDPDFFAVDAPRGGTLVFTAESLGLEECAGFTATAPEGTVLFRVAAGCNASQTPLVQAAGVEVEHTRERLVLAIPLASPGRYTLAILEGGQTDNLFDFSWDYRLTASLR